MASHEELVLDLNIGTPLLGQYKKQKITLGNKNIFRISREDLTLFFEKKNVELPYNQGEARVSLNILRDCGYNHGICRLLNSDKETGIVGDPKDIARRQALFGKHKIALPTVTGFFDLFASQFEDPNVISLIWAGTIYLFFSVFSSSKAVYIETLTIFFGILFATFISAGCDWMKEQQYLKLKDEINNQEVVVYRGQYGTNVSIPVRELVVGDVVDLNQGDRVPADCILLEEMNITVDQSIYFPKQVDAAKETSDYFGPQAETVDNHLNNPDPFLFSNSKISTGQGKAIVCAVGDNTLLARNRKPEDLQIAEEQTILEKKLKRISDQIAKYAMCVVALSVTTSVIFLLALLLFNGEEELFSNTTLLKVGKIAIKAVVILIVAIPEGLPLAVSLAMALSINSLKKDQILVKNIQSIQKCAMLNDVCVAKTGTLTQGLMSVARYHLYDNNVCVDHHGEDPAAFKRLEVPTELKMIVKECLVSNTDVRIECNDSTCTYEPKGQAIEVGLIKFMIEQDDDIPTIFINRNRCARKIVQIPFDQDFKRKVVVRHVEGDKSKVRVYVKGAPEYLIPICEQTLDGDINKKPLSDGDREVILNDVVSNQMAKHGFKVLSYAFREMAMEELEEIMRSHPVESLAFRQDIERDLIYVSTFALNDDLRAEIKETVQGLKAEDVKVRVVTGDHLDTAKYVAKECGITDESNQFKDGIALTGEQFRDAIKPYRKEWNPLLMEYDIKFEDLARFKKINNSLRIIARATSEDKLLLVSGIIQCRGMVSMTGDSISDAKALQKATVGFSMGTGCDVAKDTCDLVILDNDFGSIYKSIKWGRAIYDNVRKFIQFQLTINVSICTIILISGATVGAVPLNVVQLLWVNLIMDILGAIALGTEPYSSDNEGSKRISKSEKLVTTVLWRQILVQATYQIIVILTLMYFGTFIFYDESYHIVNTPLRDDDGVPTNRMVNDTICFHTFILMNMFNQINCRVVDKDEINVFGNVLNNFWFWAVFAFEMFIQINMVHAGDSLIGSALLGTATLDFNMELTCWILGIFSLIVNVISKQIPVETFKFANELIDLESVNSQEIINRMSQRASILVEISKKRITKVQFDE